jgi:hypothetical protein
MRSDVEMPFVRCVSRNMPFSLMSVFIYEEIKQRSERTNERRTKKMRGPFVRCVFRNMPFSLMSARDERRN